MHYTKLLLKKAFWAWLLMVVFSFSLAALPVQAQPFAYVTNEGSSNVSVIDVATNTVADTVTMGEGVLLGVGGIAFTPDGAFAYVGEINGFSGLNQVEVIDTTDNTVAATKSFEGQAYFGVPCVAATPDGDSVYVVYYICDLDTFAFNGYIAVIDVASNTVAATVDLGEYWPNRIAITPDSAYAYITSSTSNQVYVLSTTSNTLADPISLPADFALDIAITPDGAFAYVTACSSENSVLFAIDVSSNTVVANVPLGWGYDHIAITPDGSFVYAASELNDYLSVISTASNTVATTITLQGNTHPRGMAFTPDGVYIYVAGAGTNDVSVINTASSTLATTVQVGSTPSFIAIKPETGGADNEPPVITNLTVPVNPTLVNTIINASASFTDTTDLDDHSATWDWGDNNTSAGTVDQGANTVTGSHTYTVAGVYTVTLTITDDSNNTGQGTATEFVVIYQSGGCFVTGGGWITSPLGAYVDNPSLTGKANFGFNSKYKNGASVPTGNTEFQFKAAGLNFKSDIYEWLVVAGPHAKYKGVGTINGSGNYGFMLTATDGQISGGGGADTFRIKIWDKNNNDALVYDNQIGEGDDSYLGIELGGGSIVIHLN